MISVKNLRYRYPGNQSDTIQGIDFEVQPGEIFGFLGPSGAGKSTTQKIIIGLLSGYSGEIKALGNSPDKSGADYYQKIGISFEMPNLFQRLTGRENLKFFESLYSGETESPDELLEMVGLWDAADKSVSDYSKGMKMRLNFCRAFLNRPRLLFLDEPTTGQDPVNARNIKEIIRDKKAEGLTIFLTTHDMHVAAELCDRVAFIVDGQIKLITAPRQAMLEYGTNRVRVEFNEGNQSFSREFPLEGIGDNQNFIQTLREKKPFAIHSEEASLEDVFLKVTGHSLTGGQP